MRFMIDIIIRNISNLKFLSFQLQFISRNMADSVIWTQHWKRILYKLFEKLKKKQGVESDELTVKKKHWNSCFIRIWAQVREVSGFYSLTRKSSFLYTVASGYHIRWYEVQHFSSRKLGRVKHDSFYRNTNNQPSLLNSHLYIQLATHRYPDITITQV